MANIPPKAATPATEFVALLGKLVSVPKSELNSEEVKWKTMRERLKSKGETKGEKRRKLPPTTDGRCAV